MDLLVLTQAERDLLMDFINKILHFDNPGETQKEMKLALYQLSIIQENKQSLN